ncbi:MAG: response regulator transcription factor [Verrucomicrobiota bacterium]
MSVGVYIVDDHQLLRNGLRQAIEGRWDCQVVGESSTGNRALDEIAVLKPDLVMMDVHLPDVSGIEITRQLLIQSPGTKVVMLSGDANRSLVDAALEAGASGYVLKETAVDELVHALQTVIAGKLYLSPSLSAAIVEEYRRGLVRVPDATKISLTDREKQLLRLIADGCRNKEIAIQVGLSPKSVETYRSRLMRRLGCNNSAELIRYAIRERITAA